jgi:uncharacterized protein
MSRRRLFFECLTLFFIFPILLYFVRHQLAFRISFLLLFLSLICILLLRRDPEFDGKVSWRKPRLEHLKSIMIIFLPGAGVISIITYFAVPSRFLQLPVSHPFIWLIFVLLYPLQVVLQELLFRSFFFHRYRKLFKRKEKQMIFLNALSFGLAHILFGNWVAPVLSFFGGLLFAWRYHISQSLLLVSLEHTIWGYFLFIIGIGWFFYSGSIT